MYTGTIVLGEFSELQYSLSPSYQAVRLLVIAAIPVMCDVVSFIIAAIPVTCDVVSFIIAAIPVTCDVVSFVIAAIPVTCKY